MVYNIRYLETVLNFSKKFFLGLMYPFSCVLWAKMPQKLIPNHRTINSKQLLSIPYCNKHFSRNSDLHLHPVLSSFDTLPV